MKIDASEGIAEIPQNRTLLVEQLTKDEPVAPEVVAGLTNIDEVFAHFRPEIDIEFADADGAPVEENFRFHNVGDFSVRKMTEQSSFLSGLNAEKQFADRMEKSLRSNKVLHRVLDQLKTGFRDGVSYEDLYQRLLYGADCPADQYLLLADFASYCAASHRVVDTYADREKWNRMSLHNIARSGIFSADRSIADYADTIWHVPYKK